MPETANHSSADINAQMLANTVIEIADDHLILGHRLSELCGHAPMLEEDLSLPNMALDLLGQARHLYSYACELENQQRSEDDIAYLRTDRQYRNCLLVEQPNADFAHTILKQFYFAALMLPFWQQTQNHANTVIAGIAGKARKEIAYHLQHCGEWIIRLGDGTEQSHQRMQDAIDILHPYTGELFTASACRQHCIDIGDIPDTSQLVDVWNLSVNDVFLQATLDVPSIDYPQSGGRDGIHTEGFGHLLSELQYMQRTYPGMSW